MQRRGREWVRAVSVLLMMAGLCGLPGTVAALDLGVEPEFTIWDVQLGQPVTAVPDSVAAIIAALIANTRLIPPRSSSAAPARVSDAAISTTQIRVTASGPANSAAGPAATRGAGVRAAGELTPPRCRGR